MNFNITVVYKSNPRPLGFIFWRFHPNARVTASSCEAAAVPQGASGDEDHGGANAGCGLGCHEPARAASATKGAHDSGGSPSAYGSDGPLRRLREVVATRGAGGSDSGDGHARRGLQGSAVRTTIQASFGDQLL